MVKGWVWEDALSSFWQEGRPHSFRANWALKLFTGQWKQDFNCFETGGFKSQKKKIKMIFHLLPPGVIIQFVAVTLGGEQKEIFILSTWVSFTKCAHWRCEGAWRAGMLFAVQYSWLVVSFLLSAPSSLQLVHESLSRIHLPAHPAPCEAQLLICSLKKHQSPQWCFKTAERGESSL